MSQIKLIFILGSTLLAKLKRCPELIANTLSQLEQLFSKLNMEYSPEIIQKWTMEEKKFIEAKKYKGCFFCFCIVTREPVFHSTVGQYFLASAYFKFEKKKTVIM